MIPRRPYYYVYAHGVELPLIKEPTAVLERIVPRKLEYDEELMKGHMPGRIVEVLVWIGQTESAEEHIRVSEAMAQHMPKKNIYRDLGTARRELVRRIFRDI